MRIALATGIYPPDIGGPATHSSDLRRTLTERGHEVAVLTLWDGAYADVSAGLVRWPRRWPWPVRIAAICRWLAQRGADFDVVYATGLHVDVTIGGRLSGRPVVLKVVGDPAWERGRRLGLTADEFEVFQLDNSRSPRVRAMESLRNGTLRAADAIVAPSEYLAKVVERWLRGPAGVEVIPNGVRAPAGIEYLTPRGAGNRLDVVYVGRLVGHKRVERLIDATALTEDVYLRIIGSGPETSELRRRADAADGRVNVVGDLPHADVMTELSRADAIVLASDYEGLPHVVIEALACGTPVITPAVGGVTEVVREGESGLIVPPDVESIAAAMARLRDDDALLRKLTSGAATEGRRWSIETVADRLEEVFERVQRPRPRAVFVGKTRLDPQQPALRKKLLLMQTYVDPVLVGVGRRRFAGVGLARLIALPEIRPPLLGGGLFYSLAPTVAVAAATLRRPSAVVCQSPFEAVAAERLRRLVPASVRPKLVVEVHGDWRTASRLYGNGFRRLLAPVADRVAARSLARAARVRVVGEFTEGLVRAVSPKAAVDRFVAFTDVDEFLHAAVAPIPIDPHVVFVGALERYKAIDVLLETWPSVVSEMPEARLTIAGDGSLRSEVERIVFNQDSRSIEFLGNIGPSQVGELLDRGRCLVLPSRSEGLPRVVIEAFARGRAVIGARAGGIPQLVEDGRNGLLVDPEDQVGLARAILTLLKDRQLATRMGTQARATIEEWDPQTEFDNGIRRLGEWIRGDGG